MSGSDGGDDAGASPDSVIDEDVPTGPSLREQLLSGAADKPVLGVFVVVLLLLAAGFLLAGLVVAAQFFV
ncbi:MAG: hypothetical protein ABEI99_01260 [Halobaculum sp.]